MTYHIINGRIILWNVSQSQIEVIMFFGKVKRFADASEHPQCQYINFQEPKSVNVILVPFDASTVLHSGIKNRTEIHKLSLGNDESTCMLTELARKPHKLSGEVQYFLN